MNLITRLCKLEAVTPTGGCSWCAGRLLWLLDDLPEAERASGRAVCPRCGTFHECAKVVAIDRATWEAI